MLNATFNNISVISWLSVSLVEKSEKTTDLPTSNYDKLYHIMLYQVHLAMSCIQTYNFVLIGTDSTVSCQSNYHATTAVPKSV